jgi:AcrR family transcriptional regulator
VLAEHLGTGVTSIYWYFRKKEDLLNAMTDVAVDQLIANLPGVDPDSGWQAVLLNHFRATRSAHFADHILTDLLLIRTSNYSREAARRVFEQEEAILAKLIDAGFTAEQALHVYNVGSVYTRGIIIHDRILRLSDTPTLDRRQQHVTNWVTMPVLNALIDKHPLAGTTDEDFEFGLARIISGCEVLLVESGGATAKRTAAKRTAAKRTAAKPRERTPTARSVKSTAASVRAHAHSQSKTAG